MAITLTKSYQKIKEVKIGNFGYGDLYLRLYGRYTSQSTANNTTMVEYQLRHYVPSGSIKYYSSSQKITGDVTASSSNTQNKEFSSGETTLLTKSKSISHNTDGSKSISVGGSFTNSYFGNAVTISNTSVTLPKIDRLATVTSTSDFTDEQNPTLSFDNPAGFTIKPWLVIKDKDGTTVYSLSRTTGVTSPYTWSLSDSERTAMRNATNKQKEYKVQIGVDTYNGSTKLGNDYKEQKMTYVNAEPSQSTTFTEMNSKVISVLGTSNANTIIQNVSQLKLTSTPTVKKGATVSKVTFEHNDLSTDDPTSPYEHIYTPVNSKFKVTITDSRGYSITDPTEYTKSIVEYVPISVPKPNVKRLNPTSSTLVLNVQIRYKQATFGSKANVPTIQWKVGENGTLKTLSSSNYVLDTTNNLIKITNLQLPNVLDYQSEDTFYLYASDLLTSGQNSVDVTEGTPTLEMGRRDVQVNGSLYIADENRNNKKEIRDLIYPVGSIYMSINDTNPSVLFGGTWEQLKDRFLLGAGTTYSNGNTGGAATVALTTAQLPAHSHKHNANDTDGIIGTFKSGSTRSRYASGSNGAYTFQNNTQDNLTWGSSSTANTGSGNAHENMPPYLVVYMWKRTA
jgi:microcystin-dependent protein